MHRVLLVIDDYNEMIYLETLLKKMGFDVDGIQNQSKVAEKLLAFNPQAIICTAHSKKVDCRAVIRELARKSHQPHLLILRAHGQILGDEYEDPSYVDAVLDSPAPAIDLLQWMARFFGMAEDQLIEKYNKLKLQIHQPAMGIVQERSMEDDFAAELMGHIKGDAKETGRSFGNSSASPSILDAEGGRHTHASAAPEPMEMGMEEVATTDLQQIQMPTSSVSPLEREQKFLKILREMKPSKMDGFDGARVQKIKKDLRTKENPHELQDLEEERRAFVKSLFKKTFT